MNKDRRALVALLVFLIFGIGGVRVIGEPAAAWIVAALAGGVAWLVTAPSRVAVDPDDDQDDDPDPDE